MRKINLQRVDQLPDPEASKLYAPTYGMDLTVSTAQDMPTEVFVKQRFSADGSQDITVAVASAVQLQDLPINAPAGDGPFFRSNTASFQAMNPASLDEIYESIKGEIQLLVRNLDALDSSASPEIVCEISADSIVTT